MTAKLRKLCAMTMMVAGFLLYAAGSFVAHPVIWQPVYAVISLCFLWMLWASTKSIKKDGWDA